MNTTATNNTELTYSSRSNAQRAAKRLGLTAKQEQTADGRWFNVAVESTIESATKPVIQQEPIVVTEIELQPVEEVVQHNSNEDFGLHVILNLDDLVFLDAHSDPYVLSDLVHVFYSEINSSIEAIEMNSFLAGRSALELEKIYEKICNRKPKFFGDDLIAVIRDQLSLRCEWCGPAKELLRQASKNLPNLGISEQLRKSIATPFSLAETQKVIELDDILQYEQGVVDAYRKVKYQKNKVLKSLADGEENSYNSNSNVTFNHTEETHMSKAKETPEEKEAKVKAAAAKKQAEKQAAADAKAKAKAEKEAAKAAKATKVKAPRVEQNGTTRPGPDTTGGRIWAVIEAETLKNGTLPQIGTLIEHPELKADLEVNVRAIYARYKKFNGLTKSRTAEVKVEPAAA